MRPSNITRQPQAFKPRTLFYWVLALLFLWAVWSRFAEIDTLLQTLRQGKLAWIMLAVLLQFFHYALFAAVYWSSFATVEVHFRYRDLIPLTYAFVFVNATVTSGGAAGAMLIVNNAKQRGESAVRATAGSLLTMAADYGGFALVLTVGLVELIRKHDLTKLEGISALLMYLLVLVVFGVLALGLVAPVRLQRALHAVQTAANLVGKWTRRGVMLDDEWARKKSADFILSAQTIAEQPSRVLHTLALSLASHCVDIASLYAVFRAFNQPISLGLLIALFAMTLLFWIISPTPSGIGVVETLMPIIYVSVGLPLESSTIIALAFRGLSFWLPLLVGFLLMRSILRDNDRQ